MTHSGALTYIIHLLRYLYKGCFLDSVKSRCLGHANPVSNNKKKNSALLPLLRRCAVPSYVAKGYRSREREGNGVQYVVGLGVGFNRSKTSSFSPTVMRPTLSSFPDTNASTPPASAICRYDDKPVPPVYKPSRNQFKSHCTLRFGRDWLVCFTRKRSSSSQRREINDTKFF